MRKMKKASILLLLPLMLAGCREITSSSPDESSEKSEHSTSVEDSSASEPSSEIPIEDMYDIDNAELPEFASKYKSNIAEKTEKRSEFMDREQPYVVGTDNEFKFFPTFFAYDQDDEEVTLEKYPTVSVLKQMVAENYVELTGAALTDIVTIDSENATYKFSEEAEGHDFHLFVRPLGAKYATLPRFEVDFKFRVEKGFNVYTQDDLQQYDNVNESWDEYRAANGLVKQEISGIIFQDDIKISPEKLPQSFFYSEEDENVLPSDPDFARVVGSLKDWSQLYSRVFTDKKDFTFNGNYFNVDFSEIPYVVREGRNASFSDEGAGVISHATFLTAGHEEELEPAEIVNFTLKNLSIVGNANRTEDLEKSGGLIFNKMFAVSPHVYNNIATQAFTFYLTEQITQGILIEKTRAYDSFSSMLYNWGTQNFEIRDSEFIGAGGPVIIADHVRPGDDGDEGFPSETIVTNSVLESFVSGSENWFVLVNATAPGVQLGQLGAGVLPAYGRNGTVEMRNIDGIDVPHYNLIAVLKSDKQEMTSNKIRSTFQMDDAEKLDFENDFITTAAANGIPLAAPKFQAAGGEYGIFVPDMGNGMAGLVDLTFQPIAPYAMTNKNHFSGGYLNLYYNSGGNGYMGIVFGLFED